MQDTCLNSSSLINCRGFEYHFYWGQAGYDLLPFLKEDTVDIYDRFRYNLRLLLAERSITPAELSKALGWHEKRLSNLMDLGNKAEPKMHEIDTLCNWFTIDISDFFHKTGFVAFK